MIQYDLDYLLNESNVQSVVSDVKEILNQRVNLYNRYTRKKDGNDIKVPMEYYITNIASGYFGGKAPEYSIKVEENESRKEAIKRILGKEETDNGNPEDFQILIDYINDYNDDGAFFYDMVKDYVITGACYGINYETEENEIVFARVPSTQTVAVWDYSTPPQKVALVRVWNEKDEKNSDVSMVEIITNEERRYYRNDTKDGDYKEDTEMKQDVTWKLVPCMAIENPDGLGMFEPVMGLIDAYETIITNNRNLFQYNDEAKLMVTGYMPENPLLIENEEGTKVSNPDRVKEDERLLSAKVFYTPDASGSIGWLIKSIDDSASENHKRTLIELILMATCIPNVTDTGFTNADNSSALEKKFFPLEQILIQAEKQFKKEYLAMWENIVDRVNNERNTNFDFRDIDIRFNRNMPTEKGGMVQMALQLRGLLSDETIINMLPFELDAESEIAKMKEQSESNMMEQLERMQNMGGNEEEEETEDELETSGRGTEEVPEGTEEEPTELEG